MKYPVHGPYGGQGTLLLVLSVVLSTKWIYKLPIL